MTCLIYTQSRYTLSIDSLDLNARDMFLIVAVMPFIYRLRVFDNNPRLYSLLTWQTVGPWTSANKRAVSFGSNTGSYEVADLVQREDSSSSN